MQGRFEFEGSEVLALVEESYAAGERFFTEAQRYAAAGVDFDALPREWDGAPDHPETGAPAGLWLMNDRGIYLRSNAVRGSERIAHARGYRGELQIGDEAMCEFLDAAPLRQLLPDDTLVLTLDERKIRLSLVREG